MAIEFSKNLTGVVIGDVIKMRGITEEKLKKIRDSGGMHGTTMWRLTECFVEELNQWQPIESAPKGQKLILLDPVFDECIGRFVVDGEYWITALPGCVIIHPTHWMPLPELPELPK